MKTATQRIVATLTIAASLALSARAARADLAGEPGRIAGFEHNDDSSDDYNGAQHGSLFVDYGGASLGEYKWSGSWCPGRDLDNSQVALLLDALRAKLIVLPYYKAGNGGARCLTSFQFTGKKAYIEQIAK